MGKKEFQNNIAGESVLEDTSRRALSSEKREDIWAIIISAAVLLLCAISPDAVYNFFKKTLFIF